MPRKCVRCTHRCSTGFGGGVTVRSDLQDGYRDAHALVRAFIRADERRIQDMAAILSIYPDEVHELVFPLLLIVAVNCRSLKALDRYLEFAARRLAVTS